MYTTNDCIVIDAGMNIFADRLSQKILVKETMGYGSVEKGDTIFDHILLAMDGSESALQAAKVAGDLARAVQTKELQIVIAHEPVPSYSGELNSHGPFNSQPEKSQDLLQDAEDAVGNVPAAIHSELIEGQITETVINLAKTRRSDLIIMGAQ